MLKDLLTLFDREEALRTTFEIVVRERRIRLGDLREILDQDKESVLRQVHQLEKESLVKAQNGPGAVEDLRWYSVTARGLAVERALRRRRRLELA